MHFYGATYYRTTPSVFRHIEFTDSSRSSVYAFTSFIPVRFLPFRVSHCWSESPKLCTQSCMVYSIGLLEYIGVFPAQKTAVVPFSISIRPRHHSFRCKVFIENYLYQMNCIWGITLLLELPCPTFWMNWGNTPITVYFHLSIIITVYFHLAAKYSCIHVPVWPFPAPTVHSSSMTRVTYLSVQHIRLIECCLCRYSKSHTTMMQKWTYRDWRNSTGYKVNNIHKTVCMQPSWAALHKKM